jgi:hypothetical protein
MRVVSDTLTATDKHTLETIGHRAATAADVAGVLKIGHTAAYQRLERLRLRGLLRRWQEPGSRTFVYESTDTAARGRAMVAAVAAPGGLPPGELRRFAEQVAPSRADHRGHACVACGLEHVGCCGLCPHWVPLLGEGERQRRDAG